jgi:hypothetical protein
LQRNLEKHATRAKFNHAISLLYEESSQGIQ